MIKVFAVANLTRDVETRKLQSGTTMASFSIAVNRPYAKDKTDFFNCVAFSGLAEVHIGFAMIYSPSGKYIVL